MDKGTLFWVLFIVSLLFGAFGFYRSDVNGRWGLGVNLLIYVLLGLLAWQVFGQPVK